MTASQSDALVFFGATGDLAYKKISPAKDRLAELMHLYIYLESIETSRSLTTATLNSKTSGC
jgi:glucose-6-phosphate 1-dehydrogenase